MKYDLKHGDCELLIENLNDNSVDMVITSPPYDNLRTYNGIIKTWSFEKFKCIANELYRIVKFGGVIVWIVNDSVVNRSETGTSFKQALYFLECGFNLHDTMIWEKDGFSFPDNNRYRNVFEYMFVLSKGVPSTSNLIADRINKHANEKIHKTERQFDGSIKKLVNNNLKTVHEKGVRYNVWRIPAEKHNVWKHPAIFPVKLVQDHILTWSNPLDTVLDPFMGSGTTCIACMNTNRNFIGMELNDEYFEIAKRRIEEYYMKMKMERLYA